MITITNLTMQHGIRILFADVNLNLLKGKRYAIVGANGTGKSTLLRLISGEEVPSFGEINLAKSSVIGWLKQDQFSYENERIVDVVLRGKQELWQVLHEKEQLLTQEVFDEAAGMRLADLEAKIADLHGYEAEALAQTILVGLGIKQAQHYAPLSSLSGGYKMRVLLAQALFENPDVLLLDEPTNHLDIMTISWLEKYLMNQFRGVLLVVSHDLDFINSTATHILDIDYGEITAYVGNYDKFNEQKALMVEQRLQEKQSIESKIAHLQSFVSRFSAKASKATQAQSKVKQIEKLQLPDIKKSSRVSPNYQFVPQRASGKQVLQAKHIDKLFADKIVLDNIHLDIKRGEKVAIIGHNGVGKSTLLKILLGQLEADGGEFSWGYEAHIAYFAQDHHEALQGSLSVYDWLLAQPHQGTSQQVRNVLGQVLFSNDDVHKGIQTLSGGEAARLLFANIMLQKPNVIVLDEPGNHMDIESIEALSKALKTFEGTLIMVSHDRHFVSKTANRIIALTQRGINSFHGSYHEYLNKYSEDYLNQAWLTEQ